MRIRYGAANANSDYSSVGFPGKCTKWTMLGHHNKKEKNMIYIYIYIYIYVIVFGSHDQMSHIINYHLSQNLKWIKNDKFNV